MPLASADRRRTAPPPRRRRTASRIGAAAAAAGTFLAFGALAGPVFSAQAEPTGPWECGNAVCVIGAFSHGQSFVLTGDVEVGEVLALADGDMTVDLGVYTLTVAGSNGPSGENAGVPGTTGGMGAPGKSGLTVSAGAVLRITGSGTLTVAGGSGGTGGNGANGVDGAWSSDGTVPGGVGGVGGAGGRGGDGVSNAGALVIGCDADLSSTGGKGGDGGNGGDGGDGPPPPGFRNSLQGRALLAVATISDGEAGREGDPGDPGEHGYSENDGGAGGPGGAAGIVGKGIANSGALVSCGGAIDGISGNGGSVTFDSNGGEPAQVVVYAATSAIAASVLSETDWAAPILAGSTFQDWYMDADGESEVADFTELELGTTVYAHWASAASSSSFSPPPSSSAAVSSSSSAASTTPTTSTSGPAPTTATTPATTAVASTTSSGGPASLAIGVASSTPTASGGDNVTLTVNVTNPSDHDAEDVQATLQLQSTMHFDGAGSGDSGQGFRRASFALRDAPAAPLTWINCAVAGADADGYGGLLTCDLSGVLKAGAAAPALLVRTTIRPGTPPTRIDVKAASQWTSNGTPERVEAAVNLTVPEASPSLASTGVHTAWQLGVAGVLLAAGVGLMLISRRGDDATLK